MRAAAEEAGRVFATGSFLEITRQRLSDLGFMYSLAIFLAFNVFAMFLLGLYVGRRGIFRDITGHLPLFRRISPVGTTARHHRQSGLRHLCRRREPQPAHLGESCRRGRPDHRRACARPELRGGDHTAGAARCLARAARAVGRRGAHGLDKLSAAIANSHDHLLWLRFRPLRADWAGARHSFHPSHIHCPDSAERLVAAADFNSARWNGCGARLPTCVGSHSDCNPPQNAKRASVRIRAPFDKLRANGF